MPSITLKRSVASVAVIAGLLVAAAPAGASAGISDGTSNTVLFATASH